MPAPEDKPISDLSAATGGPIDAQAEPDGTMALLAQAGRRGRLSGFERTGEQTFLLECDAVPFDYIIQGRVDRVPDAQRTTVTIDARRKPLMPIVFGAVLVITVWPGVWLTDSLLATYWQAYSSWSQSMPWLTSAWYLPLTVLPLPWVWKGLLAKSLAMAIESATKQRKDLETVLASA